MNKKIILLMLLAVLIIGCVKEPLKELKEETIYSNDDLVQILEQKNPEICLDFNDEIINESFAKTYISKIEQLEDEILFKDLCLIYTISIKEYPDDETVLAPNVNDKFIVLCNEASDIIYRFWEEGSYDIPAWEFCFRKAFGEYKSYPQPPRLGDIENKETCNKLKGFKDNCLWLVAKNGDISACNLMNSEKNKLNCIEEFG